jgi:hypothetical protein
MIVYLEYVMFHCVFVLIREDEMYIRLHGMAFMYFFWDRTDRLL